MVRIDDNTDINLDQLAITHYENLLQPVNSDGEYHKSQSLIGRIKAQKARDTLASNSFRVWFWNYFLNNDYANLRRVIISRPSELQMVINEIETNLGIAFLSLNNSYSSAQLTDFGQIVKSVFNYENYRNTDRPANYFNSYNIKYCTYCNKDEIQNIEEINNATGHILTTRLYQLDHFYPRSRFPYLSLSFFNLIPGCANCNASLKGEKNFNINTHFNPFDKGFNDFFQFEINTIIPKVASDITISILNSNKHPDNAIQDFSIISRYNQGAAPEILFNMIKLLKNRTKKVQRSILNQFKGFSGSVEHSNNDLLKYQGVPLKANQINKYQYGKLKRDVCKQMELI